MYRHVLSLLAGTMVAFALVSTAPVTFAQDDLSEEGLEILPSEEIELQEYNLRLSGFGGVKMLLGADYPGIFPVGDAAALAALFARAESDTVFRAELDSASRARAWIAEPERERAAWSALLDELFGAQS